MNYAAIFKKNYTGKRIFLTGHTGFKGSWLLTWLQQLGAVVKGYALAPTQPNDLYCLIAGDKLCESTIADIRDRKKLEEAITDFQPDLIFHLAAQALVRPSYDEPLYTFETNVIGTANLLDATRKLDKPCVVIVITTDKVYENIEQQYAYKEDDKLGGYDPYSASKAAAEIIVSSYRNSFFNPADHSQHKKSIASARAGNVIGGGDRAKDRIIPDIIRGIENDEVVNVRNPASVRPWQHVLEPLSGYLLLGVKMMEEPGRFSSSWNFGPEPNDVLTVKEVTEKAIHFLGKGVYETPVQKEQLHEATLLHLDISKAKTGLQWHPKLSSLQAIEWTMAWYKKADQISTIDLCKQQIAEYEKSE